MMRRFIPFLREIAIAYAGKTVLVVTHSGLMRLLLFHVGYLTSSEDPDFVNNLVKKVDIKNTAYIKLVSDGVEFDVKKTYGIEEVND